MSAKEISLKLKMCFGDLEMIARQTDSVVVRGMAANAGTIVGCAIEAQERELAKSKSVSPLSSLPSPLSKEQEQGARA